MYVDCRAKISLFSSGVGKEWNSVWNFRVMLPEGEMKGMYVLHVKGEDGIGCSDSCVLNSCSRVGGILNDPR